ncbi:MAG TPA: 16S rRNA (cytidine(1402)-2'-O)-methyltransferase [Coxiellaceae bacterium]|nr:16S rRNA (cytidine(1402)-2'-O)-methyltransferase [Coxiellaceae bacterium]
MSKLYLVATPLGNLKDMTFRAIEVLKAVDVIAAEDTRHSYKLLAHYGIEKSLVAFHDHNETEQVKKIMTLLKQEKSVALISDAGTPLISDPGYELVQEARQQGIPVIPLPGPCAAIAALSASGLPADHFIFEGFLPAKGEARQKRLATFCQETRTVIFYESPHRILNLIELMNKTFDSQRLICVARELTKQFETIKTDTISVIYKWMQHDLNQQKGEFVVLLKGIDKAILQTDQHAHAEKLLKALLPALSVKQATQITTEFTGLPKNQVYDIALRFSSY